VDVDYSIVIPIYNEEAVLPELYRRLVRTVEDLDGATEFVFVDDGSRDESVKILHDLRAADARVKVYRFSRNFGHQAAVTCGLDQALGRAVIVIDADLQDPPELIHEMLAKWREGYEVVYAVRREREGETAFKKLTAAAFYRLIRRLTNVDIPLDTGDYRLIGREALDSLLKMRETHRFIRGMVSWIGYPQTGVSYVRACRLAGETKYPLRKMLSFAMDGVTSFSWIPLRLATYMGVFAAGLSFAMVLWVLYITLATEAAAPGWASLIVVSLFFGGVQLISLGLLGEYVGRVYDEVRQRPLYIVSESDRDSRRLSQAMSTNGARAEATAVRSERPLR
jgi:dolichol-phosphate mannosyltransferase